MRERVLAIVSHDLRNQLGVIAMGANLLSRRTSALDEADVRKPIETVQRTATSMQHLVGDLLDMASIQAGRLSIERQPTEIKPILLESCENHQPMARDKALTLRTDVRSMVSRWSLTAIGSCKSWQTSWGMPSSSAMPAMS